MDDCGGANDSKYCDDVINRAAMTGVPDGNHQWSGCDEKSGPLTSAVDEQ